MLSEEDFPNLIKIAEKNNCSSTEFSLKRIGKWQFKLVLEDREIKEFVDQVNFLIDDLINERDESQGEVNA